MRRALGHLSYHFGSSLEIFVGLFRRFPDSLVNKLIQDMLMGLCWRDNPGSKSLGFWVRAGS